MNFFKKECKEKWKKKFYLCAIGQLILCRNRDSAKRVITALLTISLFEKAGVGAISLKESLDIIVSLMSSNICQEEVGEIISKSIEDSEKEVAFEESIEEEIYEEGEEKLDLGANLWQQWGINMRKEVERKLECEDGDDFNPRHFPAFADRLIKKMATIPLWGCICRDDFGYGRIPASSAPVESEFNILKNHILCNRLLRIDIAVRTFLEYSDGKLKIFEAKSNENVKLDIKPILKPQRKMKIDVSSDVTENHFEIEKEFSADFPVISVSSTTASEIAQTFNDTTDIFNYHQSPFSSTKNNLNESFEEDDICGSKYESQSYVQSILKRQPSRQPLQDLSSEINVFSRRFVCEHCKESSYNARVCVICETEICTKCTKLYKEEEDKNILCLECYENSRKDERLATRKFDNWRGKGGSPPKISKQSKYLNKNTIEFLDAMSHKRYGKLPCLKNGTVSSLRLIKLGKSEVSLTNTCAFDSIFQILLAAGSDNENIKKFVNSNKNENDFFHLVADTMEHGVRHTTYKKRAEIICMLIGEDVKENSIREINCTTSVSSLAGKIFKQFPSFVEIRKCKNGCSRTIEYPTYGWPARSLKENLGIFIQAITTKEKKCRNHCETHQTVSLEIG